jgi:hypothetical protein
MRNEMELFWFLMECRSNRNSALLHHWQLRDDCFCLSGVYSVPLRTVSPHDGHKKDAPTMSIQYIIICFHWSKFQWLCSFYTLDVKSRHRSHFTQRVLRFCLISYLLLTWEVELIVFSLWLCQFYQLRNVSIFSLAEFCHRSKPSFVKRRMVGGQFKEIWRTWACLQEPSFFLEPPEEPREDNLRKIEFRVWLLWSALGIVCLGSSKKFYNLPIDTDVTLYRSICFFERSNWIIVFLLLYH